MEKDKEGVFTISKEQKLIAIIRRDPISRKHIVYSVKEMTSDDITDLIVPDDGVKIKEK